MSDHTTRRGVLALAGSAMLAGCGALDSVTSRDPPTIERSALELIADGDAPAAPETIPVRIEQSALADRRARAEGFLARVPTPLDAADVPNGAIRAELTERCERAREALARAVASHSRFEALDALQRACERSRAAAATWAAIDGDLTRSAVRAKAPPLRDDVTAFRRRWRYLGDDPVRAAVVHAAVESLVSEAIWRTADVRSPRRRVRDDPLSVGTLAGTLEGGRAALRDASYLYDRHVASLAHETDHRERFETAAAELAARVDAGRESLALDEDDPVSAVDRDIDDTPEAEAIRSLTRGVEYADDMADERRSGRVASVSISARQTLATLDAYESVTARVRDGDLLAVEAADDVRALRTTAGQAVDEARSALEDSPLGGTADLVRMLRRADEELTRQARRESVPVDSLAGPLGLYLRAAALARATLDATATVAATLRDNRTQ